MSTQAQGASAPPSVSPEIQKLENAIMAMDALSQEGFSAISAIAILASTFLESRGANQHLQVVKTALRTIVDKCNDIENLINVTAEEVGCNYSGASTSEAQEGGHV